MEYSFYVTYWDGYNGTFGSIQIWLSSDSVVSYADIERARQTIAHMNKVSPAGIIVLDWKRLPGDDRQPNDKVREFKRKNT